MKDGGTDTPIYTIRFRYSFEKEEDGKIKNRKVERTKNYPHYH